MMRMRPLSETLVADCSAFLFATELGQRYYPLRKLLDDAEQQVKLVLSGPDGEPVEEDFADGEPF